MAIKPLLLSVVSFVLLAFPAVAAELNTTFPGSDKIVEGTDYFGNYLVAFYQFFISAIAIMAVVVIMFAGFRWMTAQGNQERVSKAKETLTGAVVGVVLALMSWVILNFIDPNLIHLKLPNIESFATPADVQPATVCQHQKLVKLTSFFEPGSERPDYTPNCGSTYIMKDSSNKEIGRCHGWEANVNENACYFSEDVLSKLAEKDIKIAHYIGTETSQLGHNQLEAMGWTGGNRGGGSTSSIDIDCEGGSCVGGNRLCGRIWWDGVVGPYGFGEYKMSKDCEAYGNNNASKRCVLVEPLKFYPQGDDPGEGYIADNRDGTGAFCN